MMNFSPRVTIGVCVKNAQLVVRRAMKSIVEQDFPRDQMEVLVVDGYSRDNTLKIIEDNLRKTGITYKVFFENKGLGYARQVAVKNASSDYIVWIDGDVTVEKDYIRKQVEFMDKNPDVAIGRARYGVLQGESIVSFLENIPFAVESVQYKREVPVDIAGTEGSIHRLSAIIQAGGFDERIVGAAEDTDLAQRMKKAGWLFCITPAVFYEKCRDTWKGIWDEYCWWGYGGHYVYHRDNTHIKVYKLTPISGFIAGMLCLPLAYRLSHRPAFLLLPFHYFFKRIAWCIGFTKSHFRGYGH